MTAIPYGGPDLHFEDTNSTLFYFVSSLSPPKCFWTGASPLDPRWIKDKMPPQDELLQRLVAAVAATEDVPPTDLPPLAHVIDAEALQTFLESSDGHATAEFEYFGRHIRVHADGTMTVNEATSDQARFVARCNTCREEKRDVLLQTAQDFFATHADRNHAVELCRRREDEPRHLEDPADSVSGRAETD